MRLLATWKWFLEAVGVEQAVCAVNKTGSVLIWDPRVFWYLSMEEPRELVNLEVKK